MGLFKLHATYAPAGDQVKAIKELTENLLQKNYHYQTLKGVTGSGKTFTLANVIQNYNKPVIVITHTKTLASQLYSELKSFFPENAVEYYISYFDYFQPEAYKPATDTFVDKDSKTNEQIQMMRLSALNSLMTRPDTIVVASVSAIYGALNPAEYKKNFYIFSHGQKISLKDFIYQLTNIQYERKDDAIKPGTFQVLGDVIFIHPADLENEAVRVSFFGDEIEEISVVDPLVKNVKQKVNSYRLSPGSEFATELSVYEQILPLIKHELDKQVAFFLRNEKMVEAQRIAQRVKNDMDDMKEYGHCKGIENYSMYLDKRTFGERPYTILDYFPKDSLLIIDESHQMIPQMEGMPAGDASRKKNLVDYGWRLPSAMENRPLKFYEFENDFAFRTIYTTATPREYELTHSQAVVEQTIRPTGLLDPIIELRSNKNFLDDVLSVLDEQIKNNERTLILTKTKRQAEELVARFNDFNIKSMYLHAEHKTFERNEIIRRFRMGIFDVVVAINLVREGIDIPEVSKVLILDADSTGLVRDQISLIQIVGRVARNAKGTAILYCENPNNPGKAIEYLLEDNKRKRELQIAYNKKHNIEPKTIIKPITEPIQGHDIMNAVEFLLSGKKKSKGKKDVNETNSTKTKTKDEIIAELRRQMQSAAIAQDYERAIELRDMIFELQKEAN